MSVKNGFLTIEELSSLIDKDEIDTILLVFTDLYGSFLGKRMDAEFFLSSVAKQGTGACSYLLTVDMEMHPIPGYESASWEKGFGDFRLKPDLKTLRFVSWHEKSAMVICDVEDEQTGELIEVAPRTLLKNQIQRAQSMGLTAKAGSELEYYLFQDSYKNAAEKEYAKLESAGWYIEDYHMLQGSREEHFNGAVRRHLRKSGVPVECSKGEWGLGQHELNVRYSECLEMADRHCIYKQCLKEVAEQMDVSVTFMAKFAEQQAGSSCHVHLSLWADDKSAFVGDSELDDFHCSDTFRYFLGGWIKHAPEFMAFYAPNVNSYKRFQSGSFAPTVLAWSPDNRTASFRIVGHGDALRIECRIPGADVNPYLVYTAALASGLDGINNKIEPPPAFKGDAYHAEDLSQFPKRPNSLREANKLFSESEFVREVLGEEVVKHYGHFFDVEQSAYDVSVTDWERKRYFERI